MAFSAGAIVSKLTLDKSKFSAAIKGVKKQTKNMGGWVKQNSAQFKKMGMVIAAMGATALVVFSKMIKSYVETGDMIHKMALRTGFAAETLSELAYAADISGADITTLEKGVKKMTKTISDAEDGLMTYIRAFGKIGIEVKEFEGLNTEEMFMKIGAALADVEDEYIRGAVAQDMFGRAGTMLLPLFKEGAAGIEKLREEARRLGIVYDMEAATKAAKLKDAQTALQASVKGLSFAIAQEFVPVLTNLTDVFTDGFVEMRGSMGTFVKEALGFFKIIVMGIEGLMLAWHGVQAVVFGVTAAIIKNIQKQITIIAVPLELLAKIPGLYGLPARKALKMVDDAMFSLTAITEGYSEKADEQVEAMADIQVGFESLFSVLKKIEGGFEDMDAASSKALDGTRTRIEKLVMPAKEVAQDFDTIFDAVDTTELDLAMEGSAITAREGMNSLISSLITGLDVQTDVTDKKIEDTKKMTDAEVTAYGAIMSAYEGGIEGIIGFFERWAAAAVVKWVMTTLPFPANLIAAPLAMMAVKGFFTAIKSFEEGGRPRVGEPSIVGEDGAELFVPDRPGTIVPLRERKSTMGIGANITIAPVLQINAMDAIGIRDFMRDRGLLEIVEAIKIGILKPEFQEALGIR